MTRHPILLIALLLVASGASCPRNKPSGPRYRGLELEVRITERSATLLSVRTVGRGPNRRHLREPRLTNRTWRRFRPGATELLLTVHDPAGRALQSWSIPRRPRIHQEVHPPQGPRSVIGHPRSDTRTIRLPALPEGSLVTLFRTEITSRSDASTAGRYDQFFPGARDDEAGFGAKAIGFFQPGPRPEHEDWGFPPPNTWLPDPIRKLQRLETTRAFNWQKKDAKPSSLEDARNPPTLLPPPQWSGVTDSVTWHEVVGEENPSPTSAFNMAIVAEGFTENELDEFFTWAGKIADAIVNADPFFDRTPLFNIFCVGTVSSESGVTDCSEYIEMWEAEQWKPSEGPLDETFAVSSFYNVKGFYTDPSIDETTYPGYCGLDPDDLTAMKEHVTEQIGWPIHMYIVLANCSAGGGVGHFDEELVIVTLPKSGWASRPEEVTLHELGHAIAGLAEERTVCVDGAEYQTVEYANLVRKADMDDAVWRQLPETQRDEDGRMIVRHHFPGNAPAEETACPGTHNDTDSDGIPKIWETQGLGLYWGAQFIDPPPGFVCTDPATDDLSYDNWSEPLSRNYYRPAGSCRMRWEEHEFCGACRAEISWWLENWPPDEITASWTVE